MRFLLFIAGNSNADTIVRGYNRIKTDIREILKIFKNYSNIKENRNK